jgi:outer membrane receptor protein involved in Fe transport
MTNKTMHKLLYVLFFVPVFAFSQLQGSVIDFQNKQPVVGAKITSSEGQRAITDYDGKFKINVANYPVTLVTVMLPYGNDTLRVDGPGDVTITMREPVQNIQTVVVSAGRRNQEVEEVPISMEIIRPSLIDNKGVTDLEQAVEQSPGVFTMDGQVSIRGGSGFAYGAGSRVLLLWNGMPLLSGYAGDTQWNAIPMEQASQIEIMKGAASVLYGSGALNGVIALTEKEPGTKPETKVKVQFGMYDSPARESLKWWAKENNSPARPALGVPMNQQVEVYRSQMYKRLGYTVSSTFFHNDGYREGENELRGRISGTLYYRPQKWKRVKAGVGYNFQIQKTGNFLIWQSDSLGYTPSGGADTTNAESTLTYNFGKRIFIDPYVKIIDKKNNRHNIKTRMYFAENGNLNNNAQSNGATIYFAEYQFQRQFGFGATLTSGISETYNVVKSNLFGDHTSNNAALYGQYEQKFGKFDFTAGMRMEYFQMDDKEADTRFIINKKDSASIPFYPIFRTGLHYEIAKYTHLRASYGQGIRYPSVAERYTETSVGALNIFPNPGVNPEIGWAAEIGIKQGVKMGDWKGLIDVSGFINEYQNMMEFTFGIYNPKTYQQLDPSNNPEDAAIFSSLVQEMIAQGFTQNQAVAKLVGFQAQNTEDARITGIEFSFNSTGKIKEVEILSLIGYTYMNPISLNNDPTYLNGFSDTTDNILKYRFRHLAKADVEANYKNYSVGFSGRYNSFMSNIDRIFEEDLIGDGTFLLPGLKDYRKKYNKGNLVFDFRLGYKIKENYRLGFMINNVLNAEVTSRPGDIQAPRSFILQLQMKF